MDLSNKFESIVKDAWAVEIQNKNRPNNFFQRLCGLRLRIFFIAFFLEKCEIVDGCCFQMSVVTITLNGRMFDRWEKFDRQFYQSYFIPRSAEAL